MKTAKSKKELRHDRILYALDGNPTLRVNQLADQLGVSNETVRRDLTELDRLGRLARTYGGAVSAMNRFEPALNERLTLHNAERRAIARCAVEQYAREEALLLGGGATMIHFARELRDIDHRLTVVTPCYPIAVELAGNPLIDVMLLPGLFELQEGIVCGPETIRALDRYRAPIAIMGASGVSADGVSEAMLGVGEVYSAMLRISERGVVLADRTKFDKRALILLSGWSRQMSLITDRQPNQDLAEALEEGGASLRVVDPDDRTAAE